MGFKGSNRWIACLCVCLSHITPSAAQGQIPTLALSSATSQHLVQVAAPRLVLYALPNEQAAVVGHVLRAEMLTVVEVQSDWVGIAMDAAGERRGWIRQTWLADEGQWALQSLMGPGPALLAEDFTGVQASAIDLSRPASVQRLQR